MKQKSSQKIYVPPVYPTANDSAGLVVFPPPLRRYSSVEV